MKNAIFERVRSINPEDLITTLCNLVQIFCVKMDIGAYPVSIYISADLRKRFLRHFNNYYIRDIGKTTKIEKFHNPLYFHKNVSIV